MAKKIRLVSQLAIQYKEMREEKEKVLKLKGLSPNGIIGSDIQITSEARLSPKQLAQARQSIKSGIFPNHFEASKLFDTSNERMPRTSDQAEFGREFTLDI